MGNTLVSRDGSLSFLVFLMRAISLKNNDDFLKFLHIFSVHSENVMRLESYCVGARGEAAKLGLGIEECSTQFQSSTPTELAC